MRRSVWGLLIGAGLAFVFACSSSSSPPADAGLGDAAGQSLPKDENEIPCEPRAVLQAVCEQCHSRPPQRGAPFSIVNRSDVLAPRGSSVVRQLMIEQLEARRMPLQPVTLDDASRQVLLDWLKAGAPPTSPTSCSSDGGTQDADAEADTGLDTGIDTGTDAPSDAPPE